MRMPSRRLFGAAALLALTTTGLLGGTASAGPKTHEAGDTRAIVHEGNLDFGHAGNGCDVANLPGDEMETLPAGTFTIEGVNIDITANPEGYVLTGVVVKGSSAYNVYPATNLGAMPWENLHPPVNSSDGPADISHWFVCVEKATTPDEPGGETPGGETPGGENPGGNPGKTPEETEPVVPSNTTTTAPTTTTTTTTTPAAPTTTTTAPVAAAGGDDLANTGFDGTWLLVLGLALVAAGAAFVASPKLRGLLRR